MRIENIGQLTRVILLVSAIAACGDDDGTPSPDASVAVDAAPPGDAEPGGDTGTDPDGSTPPLDPTPIYAQADCGTIAVSALTPSTNRGDATAFEINQIVGGRIDPDSTTNRVHYWQVELPRGFYHLVLDSSTSDGRLTNIGMGVDRLDADGVEQGQLLRGNEIGRRYRESAFFEVQTEGLVQFEVTPRFGMEDYIFSVFSNGTAVPSPYFDDCPEIRPLSLDEVASFTLGAEGTASEQQWFSLDLSPRDYSIEAESTQDANTNMQYQLDALDRFGQEERAQLILRVNEIDTSFLARGSLSVGEPKQYWLRFRNDFQELEIEATVSPQ